MIQKEVLKEFRLRYPKLLEDALKSSGNMHNAKVLPLHSKFSECLLKTPTLARIKAALRVHGYTVDKVSFEKFRIEKGEGEPNFHAIIWLLLEAGTVESGVE